LFKMHFTGLYYLANSRFEAATQRLSNACDCLPSCVRPRVLRSIALFHLRRFEDALLGFDDCLSALETASRQEHSKETGLAWAGSDPESGEAFPLIFTRTDLMAWAARCLYSLGDLQNAVNVVNRIVQVRMMGSRWSWYPVILRLQFARGLGKRHARSRCIVVLPSLCGSWEA
jgi:hypothetical protein